MLTLLFLNMSKTRNKFWQEGLILKLSRSGISGNLLNVLGDFLKYHKERVLSNGQSFSWEGINSDVWQGSILRPLLFLIYTLNFFDGLSSNCKIFADDTFLFYIVHNVNTSSFELNSDLAKVNEWTFQWKMSFNTDSTKPVQESIFLIYKKHLIAIL